jgi:polyhydroxyalkanoate synthesis regulator protein
MNKNIYFFEVKKDEREFVIKKYPNAKIYEEAFSASLIDDVSDANILCGMVHSDFSAENL